MNNPLPEPNLHHEFSHPTFDDYLKQIKSIFPNAVAVKAIVDGNTNNSDIKWNNLAGRFRLAAVDKENRELVSLVGCQVDCFTGNCGIKAIDHLYFLEHPTVKVPAKDLLRIVESFLYHKTNCGILIGSDTYYNKNHGGRTITGVMTHGTDYQVTKPTWNPNYSWNPGHSIAMFFKDLNATSHFNYWS